MASAGSTLPGAGGETASAATLTRPADAGGFQVVVIQRPAGEPDSLLVNNPVSDAFIPQGERVDVSVPVDTFVHTDANAMVTLTLTRADGAALPGWISFDPRTGKLTGTPPPGFKGELVLRLVARDNQGREAVTVFRVRVGQDNAQERPAPQGRSGLGEQIRLAAYPPGLAAHLAALSNSAEAARTLRT